MIDTAVAEPQVLVEALDPPYPPPVELHADRRHLFLDLEDTIITPVVDGWMNAHLINLDKIRNSIRFLRPDHISIFSFALWNAEELKRFKLFVQPRIEEQLNVKLNMTPTVDDDILPACCKVMNMSPDRVTFQDMSDFWSKHEAFRLYVRHQFRHTRLFGHGVQVMLLDDAVINENFEFVDLKIKGQIRNIDSL